MALLFHSEKIRSLVRRASPEETCQVEEAPSRQWHLEGAAEEDDALDAVRTQYVTGAVRRPMAAVVSTNRRLSDGSDTSGTSDTSDTSASAS